MSAKRPLSAEQIVESILKSPKYRAIAPDAVRRIVGEEFARTGGDCEKRARNRLHQVADAFMNQAQQHALWALMERRDVMGALAQHASTRERLANVDEYLALIARHALKGELICDAACGLNPLLLGNAGYDVLGLDIQLTCVDVINAWARSEGWRVSARGADLETVAGYGRATRGREHAPAHGCAFAAGAGELPHAHAGRARRGHGAQLQREIRERPAGCV